MPALTGIVKDDIYLRHETGPYHPESPKRLEAIYRMLESSDMQNKFTEIKARCATPEEIGAIHKREYIEMVRKTAGVAHSALDPDTETSPESYHAAKMAAGGFCKEIDSIVRGEVCNAFAFVRPPGHHAEADRAAGFCLFNNVAIGAMHAIKTHRMSRILIVDWDLHHGNGTQHSFYESNQVIYFSTHQYPFYPGTGNAREIGAKAGLGYTVNVPLAQGPGNAEFVKIYEKILKPIALEFKPEIILVSAGFDIYYQDPLGGMKVTPEGFAYMIRELLNIAEECCGGKLAVILEGGYHIQGLTESAKAVLLEMRNDTLKSQEDIAALAASAGPGVDHIIATVIDQLKPYWKSLQRQ